MTTSTGVITLLTVLAVGAHVAHGSVDGHEAQLTSLVIHAEAQPPLPSTPLPERPADPASSDSWDYGCYYFNTYTASAGGDSVRGRIYWPSVCGDGVDDPPADSPMFVFVHGDGHDYLDYRYLMKHLALNGFIGATLDLGTGLSNAERAERTLLFMDFMRNQWSKRNFVSDRVALIGHSRGGEAMLTTARKIRERNLSYDVRSVVLVAPTDAPTDDGGTEGTEVLDGSMSDSLLVIYGSRDEDVRTYCIAGDSNLDCGLPLDTALDSGFAHYDRAGTEGSTEPLPLVEDVVTKSMLFVSGATHNRFRDLPTCSPLDFGVTCETHHNILRGYVNAFLSWQLEAGELAANHKWFFTGDWMPELVADAQVQLDTQYSDGYGRRVVDTFQVDPWTQNSLGGEVLARNVSVIHAGPAYSHPFAGYTIPHATSLFSVGRTPEAQGVAYLRWEIPNATNDIGERLRDVTPFDYLSVRAGHYYCDSIDNPFELCLPDVSDRRFLVVLRDASGNFSSIRSSTAYATLEYPTIEANVIDGFGLVGDHVASDLESVRMPMADFRGVDLANVRYVYLLLPEGQGSIMLDSLEFTDRR